MINHDNHDHKVEQLTTKKNHFTQIKAVFQLMYKLGIYRAGSTNTQWAPFLNSLKSGRRSVLTLKELRVPHRHVTSKCSVDGFLSPAPWEWGFALGLFMQLEILCQDCSPASSFDHPTWPVLPYLDVSVDRQPKLIPFPLHQHSHRGLKATLRHLQSLLLSHYTIKVTMLGNNIKISLNINKVREGP